MRSDIVLPKNREIQKWIYPEDELYEMNEDLT